MRHPVRVLHVLNGASGGAAESTIELARQLTTLGVTNFALCQQPRDPELAQAFSLHFDGPVQFAKLYSWNRRTRTTALFRPAAAGLQLVRTKAALASARVAMKAIAQWNVDLVHTNTFLTPEGAIAARSLGLPHIWHVRELFGPGRPFRVRGEGSRMTNALATSDIVANSPTTSDCFRAVFPGKEVTLIPNG